ncbi:hypothetical protein HPB47_001709 [Ixodes persulcatus]|uniref:Uncharacterized protein n=1 Tax=Ixodes persulcatus TaxID=34615 RepID=A0AC60PNN1_IXOPE|nr:hypothetical protein HPB47_001709 [Ixodes persulcatus]
MSIEGKELSRRAILAKRGSERKRSRGSAAESRQSRERDGERSEGEANKQPSRSTCSGRESGDGRRARLPQSAALGKPLKYRPSPKRPRALLGASRLPPPLSVEGEEDTGGSACAHARGPPPRRPRTLPGLSGRERRGDDRTAFPAVRRLGGSARGARRGAAPRTAVTSRST